MELKAQTLKPPQIAWKTWDPPEQSSRLLHTTLWDTLFTLFTPFTPFTPSVPDFQVYPLLITTTNHHQPPTPSTIRKGHRFETSQDHPTVHSPLILQIMRLSYPPPCISG